MKCEHDEPEISLQKRRETGIVSKTEQPDRI